MTAKLPELMQRILNKCDVLTARYIGMKELKDSVEKENAELRSQNEDLKSQILNLESEIESLRISHKIAPTPEDAELSKQVLSQLVRKIDRCIVQLERDEV